MIGGDFNARSGEEGGKIRGENGKEKMGERRSKNKKMNTDGRVLVRRLEETGWFILNGDVEGDEEGDWTYTGGRGESIIDYVLLEEKGREGKRRMEIAENVKFRPSPVDSMAEGKEKKGR